MASIDCGEHTYSNYGETTHFFFGTAGRISQIHYTGMIKSFDEEFYKTMKTVVQVGKHDYNLNPAVLLFYDKNCEADSKRFTWDDKNLEGAKYDKRDI